MTGLQDSEKGYDSNDREQGFDDESKTSTNGEEILEHAQHTSVTDSDDDIFDGDRDITFFH